VNDYYHKSFNNDIIRKANRIKMAYYAEDEMALRDSLDYPRGAIPYDQDLLSESFK